MKKAIGFVALITMTSACIPDRIQEKVNEEISNAQEVMADWQFKNAIAQIELHKLRNGNYPASLSDLRFLAAMDSAMLKNVEYTRLDSVYELNLQMESPSFGGKQPKPVTLQYPPEFWQGLGCVKSNAK